MRYIYQSEVQDGRGNFVAGATVTVTRAGGTTKASIYSALTGGTVDSDGIITTGTDGTFAFYVDEDDYSHSQQFRIVWSKSGFTSETWDYIQIFPDGDRTLLTSSTVDQGDAAIVGTLAWHVADASTDPTTVRILPGTYLVSTSITIAATMTLKPEHGGILADDASNATLTINGLVDAGPYHIFDFTTGSGSVVIGTGTSNVAYGEWWGAVGDGATDDEAAFDSAFNSGAREIKILDKQYYIGGDGFTLTKNRTHIFGQGVSSALYFNPAANDAEMFYSNASLDNLVFENFQVYLQNAGSKTGCTAFQFTANVSAIVWDKVYIEGFNKYGINRDSGQYDLITRCRFLDMDNSDNDDFLAVAVRYTTFANSVTIENSRFGQNDKAIRISDGSSNAVRIINNSFELDGNSGNAFGFSHQIDLTDVHGFEISGNYAEGETTASGYGFIGLEDCQCGKISHNIIAGQSGAVDKTYIGIVADTDTKFIVVEYNYFDEIIEYFISSATNTIKTRGNYYADASAEITTYAALAALMNGTAIEIDKDFTFTWNPASLADGVGETSAEQTVAGAVYGDKILVGAPSSLAGILCTGYVSDAGKVSVRLQNETTGAIDIAEGTWKIKVIKE